LAPVWCWRSPGPFPIAGAARWLAAQAGVLLLVAALLALWVAAPRRARRLPLLLGGAGAAVLLAQREVEPWVTLGGVLIGLGAMLSAFKLGDAFRDDIDPVHTYRRWVYWRGIAARPESFLPRQLRRARRTRRRPPHGHLAG
jgi:hypothetical protein